MAAPAAAMAAFTDLIWGTFVMHAKKGERGGDGGGGLDQQHCIVPRRVDHLPREGNPFFPVGEGARSSGAPLPLHQRAEQYSCRWGSLHLEHDNFSSPCRFLCARPIPDLSDPACVIRNERVGTDGRSEEDRTE